MTMTFKEALIAHLQGEKVEVFCNSSKLGKFEPNSEKEWRDFGRFYRGVELQGLIALIESDSALEFRLAPRTVLCNGVEVPAPERVAPKDREVVYAADPTSNCHHFSIDWKDIEQYREYLERGLVYLNKEDAIARAKAMLITG